MDHIELFELTSDYDNYIQSEDALLPNISLILETAKLYYNPVIIKNYLRFVAVEDSNIVLTSVNTETGELDYTLDLLYSKSGIFWTLYDFTPIQLKAGETLYFKGNNPNGFSSINMETGAGRICTFGDILDTGNGTSGKYECHGNVMSLLYGDDFEDKTTIQGIMCFYGLFVGCSGLLTAPELPATTLADACYNSMFSGCTSLVTAPELPATTLIDYCYYSMFYGCTSLVTAPELPATTLADACYNSMFSGCTSLSEAPELPATTLTSQCYSGMFQGCTSLVNAPELPATTLANECYYLMFLNCTSLVTAPELPATTLADKCYQNMFGHCTSLITAPELPATTLANACYQYMFINCTSLVTAPELPATTLANWCYCMMFQNCTNLNNIVMLATNISANNCLNNWVSGVASTGIFTKHNNMTSLPTGTSGIPEGWEVQDHMTLTECTNLTITADDVAGDVTTTTIHYTATCNGIDYKGETITGFVKEGIVVSEEFPKNTSETETVERTITFEFLGVTASTVITLDVRIYYEKQYLTFEPVENSTFKLTRNACQYSLDEGNTWTSLSAGTNTPTVSAGNKIIFKATNPTVNSTYGMGTFSSTGRFNVKGNIMSLLYGDDFIGQNNLSGKNWAFYNLFGNCTKIVDASKLILPAETLSTSCYDRMFLECTSLTKAPELPATTLADECYSFMFYNCTSLITAPELPATTLANACYQYMFVKCSKLTTAPELPATTLPRECYQCMFEDCTSLTKAPELPATKLAYYCYYHMFGGTNLLPDCSNIDFANNTVVGSGGLAGLFAGTKVTDADLERILPKNNEGKYCLPVTISGHSCYRHMFYGCRKLTTAPEIYATSSAMYCCESMFAGCISLVNAPSALYATTLKDNCYDNMFAACYSLTTSPELHATTLAGACYSHMFDQCTSLTTAPELPATTLAYRCYEYMFYRCTSLISAPELPATTLKDWCYDHMFYGCTGLTIAPLLPATTLTRECYQYMFYECTNLNNITMLATDISAKYCLNGWTKRVSSTGTFTKHKDMTSLPTGSTGIPEGWTVVDYAA